MKLKGLKVNQNDIIYGVLCNIKEEISEQFYINKKEDLSGEIKLGIGTLFELRVNDNFLIASIDNVFDRKNVINKLKQKIHLKFYGEWVSDNSIKLNIVQFAHIKKRDINPLCVLKELKHTNLDDLESNFTLHIGKTTYIPYVNLNNRKLKHSEIFYKYKDSYQFQNRFMLIGEKYNLLVSNVIDDKNKHYFFAEKKVGSRNYQASISLYHGTLNAISSIEFSKERGQRSNTEREYLNIWKEYDRIEAELKLKRVIDAGFIEIIPKEYRVYKGNDREIYIPIRYYNKKSIKKLSGEMVLLTRECPYYLSKIYDDELDQSLMDIVLPKNYLTAKILGYKNHSIVLEVGENAKDNKRLIEFLEDNNHGYISLSIYGDLIQMDRRINARERIESGESAKPLLGYIFEGKLEDEILGFENYDRSSYIRNKAALSDAVKEKVFNNEPTDQQKRAIEIALNTPDIAIIQGPPGTGKTTVISGIVSRESELFDNREIKMGRVLLSSYQHDALNHLVSQVKVYSLPTLKLGNEKAGEQNVTELTIKEWCDKYEEKLVQRNPKLLETEDAKCLAHKYNAYILNPTRKNTMEFLKIAKEVSTDVNILKDIKNIEYKLASMYSENISIIGNHELIVQIRKLRTKQISYIDDGAMNACSLLWSLEDLKIDKTIEKNKYIMSVLEKASQTRHPTVNLLEDLKNVKKELLSVCIEKSSPAKKEINPEIQRIYQKIKNKLKEFTNYEEAILFKLLQNIRKDKARTIEMVSHYNIAFAATTQQCEGVAIRKAKSISKGEHPSYEIVIVDEAARVIPSDLMIPMSQAKDKIILVGDHRQLPHMFDAEAYEIMGKTKNIDQLHKNIKMSFFEYLFYKAKELEKKDGYTRTITLDNQYRMHPRLGKFISDNFYEPYGEGFESPLGEEYFNQDLTGNSFPIEWYDVPVDYGKAEKIDKSRCRMSEVEKVIEVLRRYINQPGGKKFSYGIISFYREQVNIIKKRIKQEFGENFVKDLHVGSVDAFQGREFDVVILSVVRTTQNGRPLDITKIDLAKLKHLIADKENGSLSTALIESLKSELETIRNKNYGFISEENRLCVALSRQKRLLTVIGDSTLFTKEEWAELSEVCIPTMKRLYELCKENKAVITYEIQ